MAEKTGQQKLEAAGHVQSTVRKQREEHCCSVPLLLLIEPGTPALPHLVWVLPTQLTHRQSQRFVFMMILNAVKLTTRD